MLKAISKMSIREVSEILSKEPAEEFVKACTQDSRQGIQQLIIRYHKQWEARKAEEERIELLL